MNLSDLEKEFELLGQYKTKDLDKLNKRLIKENQDVSFLKDIVLKEQKYHRTYFQVMMGRLKSTSERLNFIEENHALLEDWWHVDQLTQFVGVMDIDDVYARSLNYVKHSHPFLRRWGYVIWMPTLIKDERSFDMIVSLLKNDTEYYVIMAEAWVISYLAIYYPEKTFKYLNECSLNYDIVGRAIQKTCDSFRVSSDVKEKFKTIRKKYK